MKQKLPLDVARTLAEKIVAALAPACERLEIAGSIRRKKPYVGDIEIVCIPNRKAVDLFGHETVSELDPHLDRLVAAGRLLRLPEDKNGDKYKTFHIPARPEVKLDLFLTTPEQWGVIFTLRTGSADFSKLVVTQQRRGGLLPNEMRVAGGWLWRNGDKVPTPTEASFFEAIGLRWVEPADRKEQFRVSESAIY